MKYSATNKPVVCMMSQSTCYKNTDNKNMKPVGFLIHSTGANNPTLKRYVQPDDNAKDKAQMLELLGVNPYANDWNHIQRDAGLNGWIGKTAAGAVISIQTMPWNYKPWGCGSGPRGSCNNGWVQVEICEDGLADANYFKQVYTEVCELIAYICQLYGIDPNGTVTYNGVKVPTILDHTTSCALGLGSNHGDVGHWFPKHGKSLATVRSDVAALLKTTTPSQSTTTATGSASGPEFPEGSIKHSELFALLKELGMTDIGAASAMGNLFAESGCAANNLQNNGNAKLGISDEEFTNRLNSGVYSRDTFIHDGYGYGLAQWTYYTRKAAMYDWMAKEGKGFGHAITQVKFMVNELKTSYKAVWAALTGGAKTIREASDLFMLQYEVPADKSEKKKQERAAYGQEMYDKYVLNKWETGPDAGVEPEPESKPSAFTPYLYKITTGALNVRKGPGTNYAITMTITDKGTYTIVEEAAGPGASKWGRLKSGAGWVSLDFGTRKG